MHIHCTPHCVSDSNATEHQASQLSPPCALSPPRATHYRHSLHLSQMPGGSSMFMLTALWGWTTTACFYGDGVTKREMWEPLNSKWSGRLVHSYKQHTPPGSLRKINTWMQNIHSKYSLDVTISYLWISISISYLQAKHFTGLNILKWLAGKSHSDT